MHRQVPVPTGQVWRGLIPRQGRSRGSQSRPPAPSATLAPLRSRVSPGTRLEPLAPKSTGLGVGRGARLLDAPWGSARAGGCQGRCLSAANPQVVSNTSPDRQTSSSLRRPVRGELLITDMVLPMSCETRSAGTQ
jgi:hypothetical protein